MKPYPTLFLFSLVYSSVLYSQTVNVTSSADSGVGSLRSAIEKINLGSDGSNTIQMQIPGNSSILLNSDLPVIKKNTIINSTGKQPISGNGQYRLFATIMADLSLTNCVLQNGAAIGGTGSGGGMGCGGGVYIDRGNTLELSKINIDSCLAKGGQGIGSRRGGGGASFSTLDKNATLERGGGDYPGLTNGQGGSSDGSSFLIGYGGGDGGGYLRKDGGNPGKGGGNGSGFGGTSTTGGNGGYCGGGGAASVIVNYGGSGGGNGGGAETMSGGGGGFGSGGAPRIFEVNSSGSGGGFGGGGGEGTNSGGGGGFGGGGGTNHSSGGRFGGNGADGGGAGLGGAIFVGDTAICIIQDNVFISSNSVLGGSGKNPGQGYAPDIFLFRKAKVIFDNQQPLNAPYSIMADQEAPTGHLDNGIVKQGQGQLTLSNPNNNYRGGTSIEGGTLSVTDPKALGSSTAPITLNGGNLQPTKSMTLTQPIVVSGTGGIDTPGNTTLTITGNISGSGAIDKFGTGTWKQTGTSTHTGDINVNGGAFQVEGIVPSNINVKPGGTLQGLGTTGGNITNSGTVKLISDQLENITIGGNYTQNPDGLLQLQMKPGNQSDYFNVLGTADVKGAIDLALEPGIYPKNQQYNLINADGGLTFQPSKITSNSRFTAKLQITPNDLRLTFVQPQIILPLPSEQLPNNQKNIANYLFCDNSPFDNDSLVDLLQNLFQLSLSDYARALATLTPEHYGALPIGESKFLQYLLTQNPPACELDCPLTTQTITILPLCIRNHHHKRHPSIPNYTQNTGGIRLQHTLDPSTGFQTIASLSYLHTHTCWADRRGNADSNGLYLDTGLGYHKNNFHFAIKILGAYSHLSTVHKLFIGYPIKAKASPHLWDLAEALTLNYAADWSCITINPRITVIQSNIFLSSITENKPKGLSLTTHSKTFSYLDTLLTLRIQAQKTQFYCCVKPYLDLGYRNITPLTNRKFTSKLDNYIACSCNFKTETYKGNANTFFMEWGLAFSYKNDMDVLFNYRTEAGKGEFVQAVNLGASWRF